MQSISELKVEIEKMKGKELMSNDDKFQKALELRAIIKDRESFRSYIEFKVKVCDERVTIIQDKVLIPVRCREAPESQKCLGCKALLKLKEELCANTNI
jgi:hypothetical protein